MEDFLISINNNQMVNEINEVKNSKTWDKNSKKKLVKKPNRNKKEKYAKEFYEQLKKDRKHQSNE